MKRFIRALKNPAQFGSGTRTTPAFDSFVRKTRDDFKKALGDIAEKIEVRKGHFYFSGFLTRKSDGQVFYFSISDVRYFPGDKMLVRTAENYRDFTGGTNQYVALDENFESRLRSLIGG